MAVRDKQISTSSYLPLVIYFLFFAINHVNVLSKVMFFPSSTIFTMTSTRVRPFSESSFFAFIALSTSIKPSENSLPFAWFLYLTLTLLTTGK